MITDGQVPEEAFPQVSRQFDGENPTALLAVIVTITAWNRISVAARPRQPGSYQA